jgi:hypothetical protein
VGIKDDIIKVGSFVILRGTQEKPEACAEIKVDNVVILDTADKDQQLGALIFASQGLGDVRLAWSLFS